MENPRSVDGNLENWNDIKDQEDWGGLLLGNGASIAVWDDFQYSSLFDKAKSTTITNPLSPEDIKLFDVLSTTNFEQVLSYLSMANVINSALELDTSIILQRYNSIKNALIQAVKLVHIPWEAIPAATFETLRTELLNYQYIFSTNYDLLIYWTIMSHKNGSGFKDYFFDEAEFDISNTSVWGKATCVTYLHGGIHLFRLPTGEVGKLRAQPGQTILDLFEKENTATIPLFISEGTSEEKLTSIYGSDYLSFAYSKFSNYKGPLVIFGSSLGNNDKHLVSAMKDSANRKFAISLLPTSQAEIISQKAQIISQLPEAKFWFFNSMTHPLGNPSLKIKK